MRCRRRANTSAGEDARRRGPVCLVCVSGVSEVEMNSTGKADRACARHDSAEITRGLALEMCVSIWCSDAMTLSLCVCVCVMLWGIFLVLCLG